MSERQDVNDAFDVFATTGDGVKVVELLQQQVFADMSGRDPFRIHRLHGKIFIPRVVFEDSPELKRLLELHSAPMEYHELIDTWAF